jgi:Domain of unknown function (DUF397)
MEDTIKTGWRKSSYSGNGGGNCIEVADAARTVTVRDSKDREGPRLAVSPAGWRAFVGRVRRDH